MAVLTLSAINCKYICDYIDAFGSKFMIVSLQVFKMERQRDESRLLFHDELSQESQHANSNDEDESLPDVNLSRGRSLVIICILFFELFERLTFYGVAANLIFYCEDVLNLTPPLPSIIALAFQGKFTLTSSPLGQMGMSDVILWVALRYKSIPLKGQVQYLIVLTLAFIHVLCIEGFILRLNQ